MRNIKICFLLVITVVILSCSEKSMNTVVVIEMKKDLQVGEVSFGKFEYNYPAEIKNDKIVFSFSVSSPCYYMLNIKDYSTKIFLQPGDSVYVSSNFLDLEHKLLSGKGVLLSNYLLENEFHKKSIFKNIDFDSIYSLNPKEFIFSIDSIYGLRTMMLEEFIKSKKVTDNLFIETEKKRIFYEASVEKNRYYRDHKFITGEKPVFNNDFEIYLKQVDFNDTSLMHLESYREFLYTYFERIGLQQKDNNNLGFFTEYGFNEALMMLSNSRIRSYVLYRIMKIHLNETPINNIGGLLEAFNQYCTNKEYADKINLYYSKLEKLKKGNKAPNFSFPSINGDTVSLHDFIGKLVYIDIWNSHCSPCFKEFIKLEELIKEYNGKDIVFIGISYDSKPELWKKTLKTKNLRGIQLYANGWNHQFGKDYLIYSNPRFILIDFEGNFIEAKAPKPSENIKEVINKYLETI